MPHSLESSLQTFWNTELVHSPMKWLPNTVSPSGPQLYLPSNQAHVACWHPALPLSLHCSVLTLCPSLSAPHFSPPSRFQSMTCPSTTCSLLCLEHHAWFFPETNFLSFLTLNSVVFLLRKAVFLHFSTLQIKSTCSAIPWKVFIALYQKICLLCIFSYQIMRSLRKETILYSSLYL